MAYALIAHTLAAPGATGGASPSIDTTGSDLLIVIVSDLTGDGSTVTDSKSNTWTGLTAQANTVERVQMWYAKNATAGSGHTFTVTSNTSSYPAFTVLAFSGSDLSSPFDQQNGAKDDNNQTSLATGSITPTVNDCVVVAGMGTNSNTIASASINGGFTLTDEQASIPATAFQSAAAYLIQTTAAAANPTWSWLAGNYCGAVIASFKPATGGGGRTTKNTRAWPLGVEIGMGWRMPA